jgi:TolB-like protein
LRYLFEDYALDTDRRELRRGTGLIPLTPQVFDLLAYIIRNREIVVSKDDLIVAVWGGRIVSESALTTRINAARSAIGDSGEQQRLIKTLPRKGIRFVGIVREEETSVGAAATDHITQPPRASLTLPDKPSIAVLSFTNMSGDPEQAYFADGMAEEIITALSRCNSLFVIARNSSFTYKGKSVDVRQIGRELGVRYVLEGSVRRTGNRLRIVGQLVDATSGAHIWADRFEGDMSDVFGLQDRITESVVGAIEPKLQIAEIERLRQKPIADLNAYDLLLRAQQLGYQFTDESLAAALRYLEQALAIDPTYAPAMALAAYCYAERRHQGWTQSGETETAEGLRLASRAVEFGWDDSSVLWMAAYVAWRLALDAHRANELADRSLLLNPNSASALAIKGWIEALSGDPNKGLQLLHRAERLSPRDPRGWFVAAGIGMAHFFAERFDEAAMWTQKALIQNPRFTPALRFLAASLAKLGQRDRAHEVIREVLEIEPNLTVSSLRRRLFVINELYAGALRLAGLPE